MKGLALIATALLLTGFSTASAEPKPETQFTCTFVEGGGITVNYLPQQQVYEAVVTAMFGKELARGISTTDPEVLIDSGTETFIYDFRADGVIIDLRHMRVGIFDDDGHKEYSGTVQVTRGVDTEEFLCDEEEIDSTGTIIVR